jgi:hypothetical protein
MSSTPLQSLAEYSQFVVDLLDRPVVDRSTVVVWSTSRYTGVAEGEVFFRSGVRLRMREELDFAAGIIAAYGYEVYRGNEKLYWYDDFPHPNDATLAATFPHHKHIPPDIKRHRIPAPDMSFERPNLPALIAEIEELA